MPETRSVPVTVPSVRAAKRRDGHPPLVMVTAYDEPGARLVSAAASSRCASGAARAAAVRCSRPS